MQKRKIFSFMSTFSILVFTAITHADVALDSSFGDQGIVITQDMSSGAAVVIRTDEKIYVTGGGPGGFNTLRYLADGSIDTSFGGGIVETTFVGYGANANKLHLIGDQTLIATGSAYGSWGRRFIAVAKYMEDGSLDVNFGDEGRRAYGSGYWFAFDSALQTQGKVIVAGDSSNGTSGYCLVARILLSSGELDATFGSSGIVGIGFDTTWSRTYGVDLQSDGKIVACCSIQGVGLGLFRLTYNGSLDTSFGTDGKVVRTDMEGGTDILVLPDDKFLVRQSGSSAIAKFNSDGSLDTTFGEQGVVEIQEFTVANGLVMDEDGNIIVVGHADYDFAIAQLSADGAVEWTSTWPVGADEDSISAACIQPDGRLVVTGYSHNPSQYLTTARYVDANPQISVSVDLRCTPGWGTLPFSTRFGVFLDNLTESPRTVAARMNVELPSGSTIVSYRAGYSNLMAGQGIERWWSQNLPATDALTGVTHFQLLAEDVTAAPYNQPPYQPSGDTDESSCMVEGVLGGTMSVSISGVPATGTLPFTSNVCLQLDNVSPYHRQLAYHVERTGADGSYDPHYRSGWQNITPRGQYISCWDELLGDDGSATGDNTFQLFVEDVTPQPYNLPPYPPAGDTSTAVCTVTGISQ